MASIKDFDSNEDMSDMMFDPAYGLTGSIGTSEETERDSIKRALHDRDFANPIRGVLEAAFPRRQVPTVICTGKHQTPSSSTGVAE